MTPTEEALAKLLYESDRRRDLARAKDNNRHLRRTSLLRSDEDIPAWPEVCKQWGFIGEHPRDRYVRYAKIAITFANRQTNHT